MKRIWVCLAILAGILLLTGYSSGRVRGFADDIELRLEAASGAIEAGDLPAAHQAVMEGAALCEEMRRETVPFLRTEDFLELEAGLRAAGAYLTANVPEEALGELSRAAIQTENLNLLADRWL